MNILEEFWYGNIEPAEYDASSNKEYKELFHLTSDTDNIQCLVDLSYADAKIIVNTYNNGISRQDERVCCLFYTDSKPSFGYLYKVKGIY